MLEFIRNLTTEELLVILFILDSIYIGINFIHINKILEILRGKKY